MVFSTLRGNSVEHPVALTGEHLPQIQACGLGVANIRIELPHRFASSQAIAVAYEFC